MESFIKRYSKVPDQFVHDFFNLAKESYSDNEFAINFYKVVKWLNVRKDNLKRTLVANFEMEYDYIVKKVKRPHKTYKGAFNVEIIMLTPDCFKELCMISQTPKAKEVRKYYLIIEKLIKKYNTHIQDSLNKELKLVRANQKPKPNNKSGVIYVVKALNTTLDSVYKIGKSTDIKNRLNTYNSGNANDIEPVFIIEVQNIDQVESCLKMLMKDYQYRKYKEVYEIDLDVLKELADDCDAFITGMKKFMQTHKKGDVRKGVNKIKNSEHGVFMLIDKGQ